MIESSVSKDDIDQYLHIGFILYSEHQENLRIKHFCREDLSFLAVAIVPSSSNSLYSYINRINDTSTFKIVSS
ncbi:hypothetical protein HZS_1732 [Henneguya salminicola]|nr:hypothetical protein HZS_1732 [Henneguya salminicola]